ncbi:hypothetical protein ACIRPX_13670 [Streptomyces sp. NPDC101225]|uniref:hypothetical protein n=1 Tax=Streptomyces sp. NPDC101225 TaxID=3366135 RepID=UPI003814D70D
MSRAPRVPSASYVPCGPSARSHGRPRLGPHGLLGRRRFLPDPDVSRYRPTRPAPAAGSVPEAPASPLPAALLPLPAGFELNRDPVASVVPA